MSADETTMNAILTVLKMERQEVLSGATDKDRAALMWASACLVEARAVWRAIDPRVEDEILASLSQ